MGVALHLGVRVDQRQGAAMDGGSLPSQPALPNSYLTPPTHTPRNAATDRCVAVRRLARVDRCTRRCGRWPAPRVFTSTLCPRHATRQVLGSLADPARSAGAWPPRAGMDAKQVGLVKQGFKLFTTEGGDKLPVSGLAEAMRSLGANPSKAQMEEYEAEIAANNQEDIDFPEFLTLMSRQRKKVQENGGEDEELAQAFKVFNRSQSGFVDAGEIMAFYKSIGQDVAEDDASDWIRDFDKDGDEKLSFEVRARRSSTQRCLCPSFDAGPDGGRCRSSRQ